MKVLFIAGFGPIVADIDAARRLYIDTMGLPLTEDSDHYFHTGAMDGAKHFALWPLSQAAESCFGAQSWPSDMPAPTSWLEFDVEDLDSATAELRSSGYQLLVAARHEPWGQIVTRFLSPEGVLLGPTYTPALR